MVIVGEGKPEKNSKKPIAIAARSKTIFGSIYAVPHTGEQYLKNLKHHQSKTYKLFLFPSVDKSESSPV
jgi:hypothetical protein